MPAPINYGDTIQAARAVPQPTKPHEWVAIIEPARVLSFSHPSVAQRGWGWRGDVLVEFADGHKTWNPIARVEV
jgi:hypothetical protein